MLGQGGLFDAQLTEDKRTALHLAAEWGHQDVVIFLVGHGADIYAKDVHGQMPLAYARWKKRSNVVAYLWAHIKPVIVEKLMEARRKLPEDVARAIAQFYRASEEADEGSIEEE